MGPLFSLLLVLTVAATAAAGLFAAACFFMPPVRAAWFSGLAVGGFGAGVIVAGAASVLLLGGAEEFDTGASVLAFFVALGVFGLLGSVWMVRSLSHLWKGEHAL
jgi:hypothetical protein